MAKTKKKTSVVKTLLVALIALILGVCIGYVVSNSFLANNLIFHSNGNAKVSVGIDSTYEELGVVCEFKGNDYSQEVEINYYNENKVKVDKIDTSTISTYYVSYEIETNNFNASLTRIVTIVSIEDLEISFVMVGNSYAGDCIYIKAGNTDILVDAGSRRESAERITSYLTDSTSQLHSYVEDGKLEYVIATHADQDHIAAFVGDNKTPGILETFEVDTLIQFCRSGKTSQVYKDYCSMVEQLKRDGTNVYTALECYRNENGASKIIEVAAGIEIEILYNYYYENKANNENDYSVCFMLRRGEEQYLFTGDLEESGEQYLVDRNDLGEVYLFKLGHHGSNTSNTAKLLNVIKPEVVIGTLCAFTTEYTTNKNNTFPTTKTINTLKSLGTVKHFYVNTMVSDNKAGYVEANGDIVVYATGDTKGVRCSNSNDDFFNFQEFKNYRRWTVN